MPFRRIVAWNGQTQLIYRREKEHNEQVEGERSSQRLRIEGQLRGISTMISLSLERSLPVQPG